MNSSNSIPKPGSWMYNMTINENTSKKYLRLFKYLNKIVIPLYRLRILPLFGFGFRLLLLTTKGRKSGKKRRNPTEYFKVNNVRTVVSGYGIRSNWFKNILANPEEVYVQAGFHSYHAKVEILEENELEDFFRWLVVNNPRYAKTGFGWNPKIDNPDNAEFSYIAEKMRVIKLHERKK